MRLVLIVILFCFIIVNSTYSHPHVWVNVVLELEVNDGRLSGITQIWKFDQMFSRSVKDTYDIDRDNIFSGFELIKLKEDNFEYLKEYNYFTDIRINGKKTTLTKYTDFHAFLVDGFLYYKFTISLAADADVLKDDITIGVFDDEYYVDYVYSKDAVRWTGDFSCDYSIFKDSKNKIYYGMVSPVKIKLCSK